MQGWGVGCIVYGIGIIIWDVFIAGMPWLVPFGVLAIAVGVNGLRTARKIARAAAEARRRQIRWECRMNARHN